MNEEAIVRIAKVMDFLRTKQVECNVSGWYGLEREFGKQADELHYIIDSFKRESK